MVVLRFCSPESLVLLFQFLLNVLEALLYLGLDLLLSGVLKIDLVEEYTVLIPDEVEDFTLGEGGYLVAVLAVTIEEPVDLHIAIQ